MDELEIRAVIRGLQCLGGDGHQPRCSDCPYHGKGLPPCRIAICKDAERVIRELGGKLGNVLEDFRDFALDGCPNLAPYCRNYTEDCVDGRGWCRNLRGEPCAGFDVKVRND